MLNIAEKLLNISKSFSKTEFDSAKEIFKQILADISSLQLDDSEFVLDKNIFKIRTLGVKDEASPLTF